MSAQKKEALKARFSQNIVALTQQFLVVKKAGKLPASATAILKRWWQAHLNWPYPTGKMWSSIYPFFLNAEGIFFGAVSF